jgi:hypothetical protein
MSIKAPMELTIDPLDGVGPIKFGMKRQDVHAVLGAPSATHDGREYFLDGVMVSFSADDCVEFVEMARSEKFIATYRGVNLHEMPADDAVNFICQDAAFDKNAPEPGYSYVFPALQISLWRGTLPESPDDEDGAHFEAIGLGKSGYFDA